MKNPVRYNLRVPFNSTFSAAEEEATLEVLRRGDIDEALFFLPNLEERSSGLQTLAECQRCADRLAPIFERLRGEGIVPSINIWWTVSFSDFPGLPREHREKFDFRWAVRQDGHESRTVACPQDQAWRQHTREMYAIFARLNPARMWIDDDMRMTLRADLHDACFCDVCLEEMSRRIGRTIARSELVPAIMADPPNAVRDSWLEFLDDLCHDNVRGLADAVREANPETQTCLMHSIMEIHNAEGRRWDRLIDALGGNEPWCRPPIGPYYDATPITYCSCLNSCRLALAVIPGHVKMAPEIENYPQSRFMTSPRGVKMSLVFAQLFGMGAATISAYRYVGRLDLEIQRHDAWSGMLHDVKPYLQSIAELGVERHQFQGISMFHHGQVCRHTRDVADEPKPIFLYRRRPLDDALPLLGFATRYDAADVTVFAGEHIACLNETERHEVFGRGVLLDGRAAETLLLSGDGALAGLKSAAGESSASFETIEDAAFGGLVGDPINLRWESTARQFDWLDGARTVSLVRDYDDCETGHVIVLYENELGGRVAVIPYDSQAEMITLGLTYETMCTPGFLSFPRQAQLKAVLEWLNRGPLPLFVPGAPSVYPLLIRQEKRLIASVTNLMTDPVSNLSLELAVPGIVPVSARHLQQDGTWADAADLSIDTVEGGAVTVRTSITAERLEPVVLLLDS